jgi:hypothetical protein
MNIIIVFSSSLSSMVSSRIVIDRHFKNKDSNYIVVLNRSNDKEFTHCKTIYQDVIELNRGFFLQYESKFYSLAINLVLSFLLTFISLFFRLNIYILQPRPSWARWLNLAATSKNHLHNIFYGDGFLFLCDTDRPYWLTNSKGINIDGSKHFYYMHASSFSEKKYKKKYYTNILTEEALEYIVYFYKKLNLQNILNDVLNLKNISGDEKRKLFILTTSTFYQNNRCNATSEIQLYLDYLGNLLTQTENYLLLIKPHPINKFDSLLSIFNSDICKKSLLVSPTKESFRLLKGIPIEFLLYHLEKNQTLFDDIEIHSSSFGILVNKKMFQSFKYLIPFGDELICKYFFTEHQNLRSKQEKDMRIVLESF